MSTQCNSHKVHWHQHPAHTCNVALRDWLRLANLPTTWGLSPPSSTVATRWNESTIHVQLNTTCHVYHPSCRVVICAARGLWWSFAWTINVNPWHPWTKFESISLRVHAITVFFGENSIPLTTHSLSFAEDWMGDRTRTLLHHHPWVASHRRGIQQSDRLSRLIWILLPTTRPIVVCAWNCLATIECCLLFILFN